MRQNILITGVMGQDGWYLARYILLNHPEYNVVGLFHKNESGGLLNPEDLDLRPKERVALNFLEIADRKNVESLIQIYKPVMVFNFAGFSDPRESLLQPELCFKSNVDGVLNFLEAIKKYSPKTKFLSCGSSLELGLISSYNPKTPYAISKAAAGMLVKMYREKYGLFTVHAVLFNHTSPRSNPKFLAQKLCLGAARAFRDIKNLKDIQTVEIDGNLNVMTDWSDSRDVVFGLWTALNAKEASDYHFCSGRAVTGYTLAEMAFSSCGIPFEWEEDGMYLSKILSTDFIKNKCLLKLHKHRQSENPELSPLGNKEMTFSKLGWRAEIPIDITINSMVEFALSSK